jgi:hypothetical protein
MMVILIFVIPAILGISYDNLAHHRLDRTHRPRYRESHSGNNCWHFRCDSWCIQIGGTYRGNCLWDHIQNHLIALSTLYEGSARSFTPRYPHRILLLILDPPTLQQSQQANGVLPGQIRYVRESSSSPEIIVRPPSYYSDDEYVDPLATGRK